MNRATLQQFRTPMQDRQDAKYTMKGLSLTKLIHRLIREHGTHGRDGYDVDLRDFDNTDRKLILSYLLDSEVYEQALASPTILEVEFWEHRKWIERLIDEEMWEVYQEDQEEARAYR